jgi:serine phosphatase RsbU (regulator of sigma subunit)
VTLLATLIVAMVVLALAVLLVRALAGDRRGAGRAPVATATRPVETVDHETAIAQERSELEAHVTSHLWHYLDDAGLWLPNGTTVETLFAPLEGVGGDFIGTMAAGDAAVAYVGDVAGHGLDSALVALRIKDVVASALAAGEDIDEAVRRANELLVGDLAGIATLFVCALEDGTLSFVNAGHVPPLVLEGAPADQPDELPGTGPLLGAVPFDYEPASVEVGEGARLLAFTDGVTEAYGSKGGLTVPEIRATAARQGGFKRLQEAVDAKRPEPVKDDIAAFELTAGGDQFNVGDR